MIQIDKRLGITTKPESDSKNYIDKYISLRLAAIGVCPDSSENKDPLVNVALDLLKIYHERSSLLRSTLAPINQRIQSFINRYFLDESIRLPLETFTLDFYGIARALSIPKGKDEYLSEYVSSYRIKQGILHNPRNDRRTTKGVFHIAEGGLPIPDDKKSVPIHTASFLLKQALNPDKKILELPYTAGSTNPISTFVSLLIRPTICPEIPSVQEKKTMEIHCFAPGSLVSNLDFLESIFGNDGNPYQLQNDAGLDIEHWSGHTGCIILAPQLTTLTKKECGLPHISEATERQKKDGMCWEEASERYNEGEAFKITMRTEEGIMVTVIADNYFGYSKKEVKTMLSYASNLFGNTEEEHAGGAFVFPAYNQGYNYQAKPKKIKSTFAEIRNKYSDIIDFHPEGYGVDKKFPCIHYLPENTFFSIITQRISWAKEDGSVGSIKLLPKKTYILPNGSKFRMESYQGASNYRLIEAYGNGTFIHKPCTVSGGGKSELSKSISDAIIGGSFFIHDFEEDFKLIEMIINADYSDRYANPKMNKVDNRSFLSPERSVGSVIKLLTPSDKFSDTYNAWLENIPQYVKGIAFIVKRFYKQEWGKDWKSHFSVDTLNGQLGHELKFDSRKIFARYLRVGFAENGTWRTFKLRQDFVHAEKLQMEDDISVSCVIPSSQIPYLNDKRNLPKSMKLIENCEHRFFQRPDDAILRGYDKKAEKDLSSPNTFVSNFEPLTSDDAKEIVEDSINFDKFTPPMRELIEGMSSHPDSKYFVSSAQPRLVDGKPTKNVRYLQVQNDFLHPEERYIAEIGLRFSYGLSLNDPLFLPVDSVFPGRRNNPAETGIRPLAVYNPIHYQELPELFMDFICSLTGKSPSTTGAGSEGALTKAPFNALCTITDLNNALVSYILTGQDGFTSSAGYIGRKYRVDHDISLLVPELWSRMSPKERDPKSMISQRLLEKLEDFEYNGKTVRASILGYRITQNFVNLYFARIFENPNVIFSEEMLQPERQSMDEFVDGINNIVENQKKVAQMYFNDGSIEGAVPPLKALLHIMVHGHYNGKGLNDPEIRSLFSFDALIQGSWYKDRLRNKQQNDISLWTRHIAYLTNFLKEATLLSPERRKPIEQTLDRAKKHLLLIESDEYLNHIDGCIGKDVLFNPNTTQTSSL